MKLQLARSIAFLTLGAALASTSCRFFRKSQARTASDLAPLDVANLDHRAYADGLDAVDMSVLFARPTTEEHVAQMLALGVNPATGAGEATIPPRSLMEKDGKLDYANVPRTQEEVKAVLERLRDGTIDTGGLSKEAFLMRVTRFGQSIDTSGLSKSPPDPTWVNARAIANPVLLTQEALDRIIAIAEKGLSKETIPEGSKATFSDRARRIENWRVVSMRFKPCDYEQSVSLLAGEKAAFKALSTSDLDTLAITPDLPVGRRLRDCSLESNLVAQPVYWDPAKGKVVIEDHAVHLLNHFPFVVRLRDDGRSAFYLRNVVPYMREMGLRLRQIKHAQRLDGIDTRHTPVGVHPAFVRDDGKHRARYMQIYKEFMKQYYGMGKLNLVALGGVREDSTWIFLTAQMNARGSATARADSTNVTIQNDLSSDVHPSGRAFRQVFSLENGDVSVIEPQVADVSVPSLTLGDTDGKDVFDGVPATIMPLVRMQLARTGPFDEAVERGGRATPRGRALKQALVVANPERSRINTMDCISCHNVTPRFREEVVAGATPLDPVTGTTFAATPSFLREAYSVPAGVTAYIDNACAARSVAEVRNFAYFFERCSIGTRLVNESAMEALFVNQLLGWENPSPLGGACDAPDEAGVHLRRQLALCSEIHAFAACRARVCR